jgi:hypothetical protein
MFENRVLRRICGPKRKCWEAGGDCILVRKPEEKRPLGKPRCGRKWGGKVWTEFIWLWIGTNGLLL